MFGNLISSFPQPYERRKLHHKLDTFRRWTSWKNLALNYLTINSSFFSSSSTWLVVLKRQMQIRHGGQVFPESEWANNCRVLKLRRGKKGVLRPCGQLWLCWQQHISPKSDCSERLQIVRENYKIWLQHAAGPTHSQQQALTLQMLRSITWC